MSATNRTLFRDLPHGASFDFIDPARPSMNSFFLRCTKISGRRYEWVVPSSGRRLVSSVGTINVEVFHVEDAQ